jgi:hypothetical protein
MGTDFNTMTVPRHTKHHFTDLRPPSFVFLLLGILSTLFPIGCSKTAVVDGEVFVRTQSSSPNNRPLSGVQVYFFTEKQKSKFEEELAKWRENSQFQARRKLNNMKSLMEKQKNLFAAHAGPDGSIDKKKVSEDVWAEAGYSREQIEELNRITLQLETEYWETKYPSALDRSEEYSIHKYDLQQIGEDAAWAVTDTNGAFKLSLTLGKVYWVWCSGSTSGQNVPTSNPWQIKYVPDGGKLVLSDINRLSSQ